MPRRAVLIVEDDPVVRAGLSDYLSIDDELIVDTAGTLSEANAALNDNGRSYATVILDIGMPDGDGRDFCTSLRRRGLNIPIIMLSGSVAEVDIVRGLEAGANDYITKPFRPAELAARLRVQFRTLDDSQGVSVAIGPYTFLPSAKLLHDIAKNRRVRLTNKEVAILEVALSFRCLPRGSSNTPARGLGLQHYDPDPHVGNAHSSPTPKNGGHSGRPGVAGYREQRLSPQLVLRYAIRSSPMVVIVWLLRVVKKTGCHETKRYNLGTG